MSLGIIGVLLLVLGIVAVVGFFVLKRALKWAVRLALLFVAIALMLAGAVAWAWYSYTSDDAPAQQQQRNRNAATQPANRKR